MARPSGAKVVEPCRYCGERYKLTNWMRRRDPLRDAAGRLLSDTHLIACHAKYPVSIEVSEDTNKGSSKGLSSKFG